MGINKKEKTLVQGKIWNYGKQVKYPKEIVEDEIFQNVEIEYTKG